MKKSAWVVAKALLLCAAFAFLPGRLMHAQAEEPIYVCGDFLAELGKKPKHLNYERCEYHADEQLKPLVARYSVSGRDAAGVEASLAKSFGLKKLRFECCGWSAREVWFKDKKGREYMLHMASEETLANTRAKWSEIPVFHVWIELVTEEP
ncbi:MAG: DUF4952 domain-containing protein [Methylobacillus sp.]|nr:DUF4952 domain-containing protein [Methylobacillus sp.]